MRGVTDAECCFEQRFVVEVFSDVQIIYGFNWKPTVFEENVRWIDYQIYVLNIPQKK